MTLSTVTVIAAISVCDELGNELKLGRSAAPLNSQDGSDATGAGSEIERALVVVVAWSFRATQEKSGAVTVNATIPSRTIIVAMRENLIGQCGSSTSREALNNLIIIQR